MKYSPSVLYGTAVSVAAERQCSVARPEQSAHTNDEGAPYSPRVKHDALERPCQLQLFVGLQTLFRSWGRLAPGEEPRPTAWRTT